MDLILPFLSGLSLHLAEPFCPTKAVQNLRTKGVSYRQAWILEVIGRIVGHADFLHHSAGSLVCGNGEGNNQGGRDQKAPMTGKAPE